MWGSFREEITMFDLCSGIWVAQSGRTQELGSRGQGQICLGGHCYRKRLRGLSSSRNSYVSSMSSPTMSPKFIRYGFVDHYWKFRAMFYVCFQKSLTGVGCITWRDNQIWCCYICPCLARCQYESWWLISRVHEERLDDVAFLVVCDLQCLGPSMLPTFNLSGDILLLEHLSSRFEKIKPGDVVMARSPANPRLVVCKRVLGLEGDSVTVLPTSSRGHIRQVVVRVASAVF